MYRLDPHGTIPQSLERTLRGRGCGIGGLETAADGPPEREARALEEPQTSA